MIPLPYRLLGGALIALLLFGGVYFKGRSDGRAVIQAKLDEQRATWQGQFDRQAAATEAKEAAWAAKSKEIEDALQVRLETATADGASLSERLRDYQRARRCPLPQAPGAAPDVAGPARGTEGDEATGRDPVERATGAVFAACARDSTRLGAWQEWYRAIQ